MLNRGVVIVRPKQPYRDWAAGLGDSGLVPDPNAEQTVYLIKLRRRRGGVGDSRDSASRDI
jgi:hypothetical protein